MSSSYAFGDGAEASDRLAVVHRVFAPMAERLLEVALTDEPHTVVDLGCGPGHTTALLAARWPNATVTAVEASPAFATAARIRVPSATVIEGDVTDPDVVARRGADLLYARCLLAHLPDVSAAISTWRQWLAPGGRLVVEEPERIDTDDEVFQRYLRATASTVAARGATMLAGSLVHAAVEHVEGVLIDREVSHRVATCEAALMFQLNLVTIRRDAAAGLEHSEADELATGLAARRTDGAIGAITWHVRQVVLTAED